MSSKIKIGRTPRQGMAPKRVPKPPPRPPTPEAEVHRRVRQKIYNLCDKLPSDEIERVGRELRVRAKLRRWKGFAEVEPLEGSGKEKMRKGGKEIRQSYKVPLIKEGTEALRVSWSIEYASDSEVNSMNGAGAEATIQIQYGLLEASVERRFGSSEVVGGKELLHVLAQVLHGCLKRYWGVEDPEAEDDDDDDDDDDEVDESRARKKARLDEARSKTIPVSKDLRRAMRALFDDEVLEWNAGTGISFFDCIFSGSESSSK